MKANLHWIKKLLQVSFVPAEIRPGKSRPEIYMVPTKKETYLFACFIGICTCGLTMSKKTKNLEKTKIKNNIPGLLQKQKSKKPRENQKKQKNQKKQYSRTLAKVKMQKSKKPRENQKKTKKTKNTIFQKSGDRVNRQESWNIVFFVFFGFLEVFGIFACLLLQESWNIVFFWFFVFFGFLEVFWIFAFARVLEYCFFFGFSRGFLNCFLLFLNFFVLEIWARV